MKIVKKIIIGFIILFFGSAALIGFIEGLTGITIIPEETTETISQSIEQDITEKTNSSTTTEIETTAPTTTDVSNKLVSAPIRFIVLEYSQDYLGGNSVRVSIKNLTNKTITGIQYTLAFYNFKGELLYDTIRGWSSMMWTTESIQPGQSIGLNGGTFYNSQFTGKYTVIKIEIGYSDGTLEIIETNNFDKYEQICFSPNEVTVWTQKYAASFHTENCEYRNLNKCNDKVTMSEAYQLDKIPCSFCFP